LWDRPSPGLLTEALPLTLSRQASPQRPLGGGFVSRPRLRSTEPSSWWGRRTASLGCGGELLFVRLVIVCGSGEHGFAETRDLFVGVSVEFFVRVLLLSLRLVLLFSSDFFIWLTFL